MGSIVKSIGTGGGRDYSTVTSWEADLDSGAYASGDDAFGQMYNDSAFNEAVTIDGGATVGLNSITLQGASGQRHTGIAGTGARFVQSSAKAIVINVALTGGVTFEWLEVNFGGFQNTHSLSVNYSSTTAKARIRHNLIHDGAGPSGAGNAVRTLNATADVIGNVIYNFAAISGSSAYNGIDAGATNRTRTVIGNTVYNITKAGSGAVNGISEFDVASHTCRNNAVFNTGGATSGTKSDFNVASTSLLTASNNCSSDGTAFGSSALTSKVASNQFVSLSGGSEDFHLKAGADLIGAGADLGTTPDSVQYDIDGYDRDAAGVTWDIGADQRVTGGGGSPLSKIFQQSA